MCDYASLFVMQYFRLAERVFRPPWGRRNQLDRRSPWRRRILQDRRSPWDHCRPWDRSRPWERRGSWERCRRWDRRGTWDRRSLRDRQSPWGDCRPGDRGRPGERQPPVGPRQHTGSLPPMVPPQHMGSPPHGIAAAAHGASAALGIAIAPCTAAVAAAAHVSGPCLLGARPIWGGRRRDHGGTIPGPMWGRLGFRSGAEPLPIFGAVSWSILGVAPPNVQPLRWVVPRLRRRVRVSVRVERLRGSAHLARAAPAASEVQQQMDSYKMMS